MADPFRRQKIENWAAEFADADEVRPFPGAVQEFAASIGEAFLVAACAARDVEPGALSEADAKAGLLDGVGRLALPADAHARVPDFCAAFLGWLQKTGRAGGASSLPGFVRALRASYRSRAALTGTAAGAPAGAPPVKRLERPGSKLGPNDPCPCGSGKKYKKCCRGLLG